MITPTKERTIIVPDVHGRHMWHRAVPHAKAGGTVIFLGDYLDPYPSEGITPEVAIEELREIISFAGRFPQNVTLLLGNHDLHYFTSVPEKMEGGRLDEENADLIRSLYLQNKSLFSMARCMEIGGRLHLFSHAGILRGWVLRNFPDILVPDRPETEAAAEVAARLNAQWEEFDYDNDHPSFIDRYLAQVSYLRGGSYQYGSPVWADVEEFGDRAGWNPSLERVYQIFGHTQQLRDPILGEGYAMLDCRRIFNIGDGGDPLVRELPMDDCPEGFVNPDTSRPPLFKKYSSIENEFNEEFLGKVREEVPSDTLFAVQEKVHGTNVSFICEFLPGGKISMNFAKRTAPVAADENFYSHQEFVMRYRPAIENLSRMVSDLYYPADGVVVFGEMFGGSYPHPDVKRIGVMSPIQKGVFYSPTHEFYGFDIYVPMFYTGDVT